MGHVEACSIFCSESWTLEQVAEAAANESRSNSGLVRQETALQVKDRTSEKCRRLLDIRCRFQLDVAVVVIAAAANIATTTAAAAAAAALPQTRLNSTRLVVVRRANGGATRDARSVGEDGGKRFDSQGAVTGVSCAQAP